MSDFLGYLIARSYNRAEVVQPRPVSLFEPSPEEGGVPLAPLPEEDVEESVYHAPAYPPAVAVAPQPNPWPPPFQNEAKPSARDDETIPQQAPLPLQTLHVVERTDEPRSASLAPPSPPQSPVPPASPLPFDIPAHEQAREPDLPPPPAASLRSSAPAPAPVRPEPPPPEASRQLIPMRPPLPSLQAVPPVEDELLPPQHTRPPVNQPEESAIPRRPLFEPVARKTVLEPATKQIVIERIVETVKQPEESHSQALPRGENMERRARHEPLMPRPAPERLPQDPASLPPSLAEGRDRAQADAPRAPEAPPTIHVTIGRVEVRATTTSHQEKKKSRPQPTVMSLDDYLKQRAQGGSR